MVLAFDRVTSFDVLSREIAAFGSGRRLDNEADAWAVLQEPEVVVLRWPIEQAAVSAAREQGRPEQQGNEKLPAEPDHQQPALTRLEHAA